MKSLPLPNKEQVHQLLDRGVEEAIDRDHLTESLNSGAKLRIKFGIDPTGSDLHLGHAVVLRKLRQFQDLGHKVVLIIGDFTATIGDPSGRSETRKPLTEKEVKANFKKYLEQALKILSRKNLEVRYNSEWHKKEGLASMLRLASSATIQQTLQRRDFKDRMANDVDITLLEIMYPLLQGYDSVKINADVELGGTDQKFNLLMGRRVQRSYKMKEQDVITVPLLEGTDGVKKMSKSLGNYIALNDSPNDMFEKVMTIHDSLIAKYFLLCTDVNEEEINEITKGIENKTMNPKDIKLRLAKEIVGIYHGAKAAEEAEKEFKNVFEKKELPTDMPTFKAPSPSMNVVDLLLAAKLAPSKSEARRLIEQGGVKIDEHKILDHTKIVEISSAGHVLQVGKRHFVRVTI